MISKKCFGAAFGGDQPEGTPPLLVRFSFAILSWWSMITRSGPPFPPDCSIWRLRQTTPARVRLTVPAPGSTWCRCSCSVASSNKLRSMERRGLNRSSVQLRKSLRELRGASGIANLRASYLKADASPHRFESLFSLVASMVMGAIAIRCFLCAEWPVVQIYVALCVLHSQPRLRCINVYTSAIAFPTVRCAAPRARLCAHTRRSSCIAREIVGSRVFRVFSELRALWASSKDSACVAGCLFFAGI